MKIAILYDVIYPFSIGGGEKNNWEIARRLAVLGHDVWLVTSRMWPGDKTIIREGVNCVGVCGWHGSANQLGNRSFLQPLLFAFGAFWFLRRNKFDVVACCAFPYLSCFTAKLATIGTATPLAIIWYEARGFRAWINQAGLVLGCIAACLEWLCGRLTMFNQTISGFSAHRMTQLLGMPRENITVIHAGVDARAIQPKPNSQRHGSVLAVNRLIKHKRTDLIVRAFAAVSSDFPDCTLLIVGNGVEKPCLETLTAALGMSSRVQFIDHLESNDLYNAFGEASVFVLASDQEGFGIVVLEAMAAGAPVLVRRAPLSAAASIVTDGHDAILFDNEHDLAAKLRELLQSPDLCHRLTAGGRQTANANDWDTVIVPMFERWLTVVAASATRLPRPR